jgi:CheY-like chemotaxis protein
MNSNTVNILVVDDDAIIRDMMIDILDFEGYTAESARNGREALAKLQGEKHYLIFLDLMMPIMDGREFCQQLQALPELRKQHIIVVMSALDNLVQTSVLNVDAVMPKPFTVEDVLHALQPYVN